MIPSPSAVIQQYRTHHGLTQSELAERVKLDQSMLSRYERGSHEPAVAAAIQIERATGVPAEQLNGLLAEFVTLYQARQPAPKRQASRK